MVSLGFIKTQLLQTWLTQWGIKGSGLVPLPMVRLGMQCPLITLALINYFYCQLLLKTAIVERDLALIVTASGSARKVQISVVATSWGTGRSLIDNSLIR
jgi:hypothetical protein